MRETAAEYLGVEAPELERLRRVTWGSLLRAALPLLAFFALASVLAGMDLNDLGILLGLVSIVAELPMTLLTVLTALAGASTIVTGTMLIFGVISLDDLDSAATTQRLDDDWWWYAIYLALVIAGIVIQIRSTMRLHTSLRRSWVESGGRELGGT